MVSLDMGTGLGTKLKMEQNPKSLILKVTPCDKEYAVIIIMGASIMDDSASEVDYTKMIFDTSLDHEPFVIDPASNIDEICVGLTARGYDWSARIYSSTHEFIGKMQYQMEGVVVKIGDNLYKLSFDTLLDFCSLLRSSQIRLI